MLRRAWQGISREPANAAWMTAPCHCASISLAATAAPIRALGSSLQMKSRISSVRSAAIEARSGSRKSSAVFGRTTFDRTRGFSTKWPFVGKRSIVVTSRPLVEPPEDAESWGDGVALLIKALRNETGGAGDAWVIGGAKLQSTFIAAGALDSLDLFIVPVLLGEGIRTFAPLQPGLPVTLRSAETLDLGIVRLSYDLQFTAAT